MRILASAALAVSVISAPANSAIVRDYDSSLFLGLQMRNEPIVLFVTDGTCETCAEADRNIRSIASTRGYDRVHVLKIDIRKQKWAVRGLGIQSSSTLIGFHGFRERQRLANEADLKKVSAVFASALR